MTTTKQPKTLQHDFALSPLKTHFIKSPNPPAANRLIDLPPNDFLDTEDEFNVVAAALWSMCVRWDKIEDDERPKTREGLRGWILKSREDIMGPLTNKVEPPFAEWSVHQMEQDVAALSDELLAQTLPPEGRDLAAAREKKDD